MTTGMKLDPARTKLTPPEVAKAWGISPEKVLAWIRSGELRAVNVATKLGVPRLADRSIKSPESAGRLPGWFGPPSGYLARASDDYQAVLARGSGRQALLRRILQDEPVLPRRLNSAIPADLETIVTKAIAKTPAERYATAGDLADDLERFLADKPIRARRPSLTQKVGKWSYRHRKGVATTIVAVFAVLLAASALIWHGKGQEMTQRKRAQQNLQLALEAMDRIYLQYADDNYLQFVDSAQQTALSEEGEKLLKEAMRFYEQFARANRGEPSVRIETAKAYRRVGAIRKSLGQHDEAAEAYHQARELLSDFLSQSSHTPEARGSLAEVYRVLGEVHLYTGDHKEAIANCTEAIRLNPDNSKPYNCRGIAHGKMGDLERAIADLSEAIRIDPDKHTFYANRGNAYRLTSTTSGPLPIAAKRSS